MTIEDYEKLIALLCKEATWALNPDRTNIKNEIVFSMSVLNPSENEYNKFMAKATILLNLKPLFKEDYISDNKEKALEVTLGRLLAAVFTYGISNAINVQKQLKP